MSRIFGKPFTGKEQQSAYMQFYNLEASESKGSKKNGKKKGKHAERPTARISTPRPEEPRPRPSSGNGKSGNPQWADRATPPPEFAPWAARALLGEIATSPKALALIPAETRLALIHHLSQS